MCAITVHCKTAICEKTWDACFVLYMKSFKKNLMLFHFSENVLIPFIFKRFLKSIIYLSNPISEIKLLFLYELHYFELPLSSYLV